MFFNVFGIIIPLCWLCSVIIHVRVTLSPLLLLVDQFVCHTEAIADIVILVDGSWSIGRLNFRLVRMFLENLVNAFDVGIDKTRIGGSLLPPFFNRWAHHGTSMVFGCLCECFNQSV